MWYRNESAITYLEEQHKRAVEHHEMVQARQVKHKEALAERMRWARTVEARLMDAGMIAESEFDFDAMEVTELPAPCAGTSE